MHVVVFGLSHTDSLSCGIRVVVVVRVIVVVVAFEYVKNVCDKCCRRRPAAPVSAAREKQNKNVKRIEKNEDEKKN